VEYINTCNAQPVMSTNDSVFAYGRRHFLYKLLSWWCIQSRIWWLADCFSGQKRRFMLIQTCNIVWKHKTHKDTHIGLEIMPL
jgi:hypothetical protein